MSRSGPIETMRPVATDLAAKLRALAHRDRLLILCRLSEGEASVSELVDATGLKQAIVSQHLATLREADAVASRAEQQSRIYTISDPQVRRIFDALCATCGPAAQG
jgi:ArsR family transcriptional regulator, virulence genes transcriptional regulator